MDTTHVPYILLSSPLDDDGDSTSKAPPEPQAGADTLGDHQSYARQVQQSIHPTTSPVLVVQHHNQTELQQQQQQQQRFATTAALPRRALSPNPHVEDEYVQVRHSRTGLDCTTAIVCKRCGTNWSHSCSVVTLAAIAARTDSGGVPAPVHDVAAAATGTAAVGRFGRGGDRDYAKRSWYEAWLRDKTVEREDSWGFSSTGVSRAASPARSGTV